MNIKFGAKNYFNLTSNTAFGIDLRTWLQLLARNRFAIDIRFLPKVLFLTGNVVINIPLQIFERLKYNKKIKAAAVKSPLFILGHPRSGTTYLLNVLSRDPQFAFCQTYEALTPHIFLTTGAITKKLLQKTMPATRPQDNVKTGADMPIEEEFAMGSISDTSLAHGYYFPRSLKRVFDEAVVFEQNSPSKKLHWQQRFDYFLKKLTYKNNGKRLLLKSPANTGRVKEILELYPDAKFIHIHRDPYMVYQSNVNLYEKILPLLSFQTVENQYVDDFILYSYEKMNRKYLQDRQALQQHQIYEVSYTDFVADPMQQLKQAYTQLQLGDFDAAAPRLAEEIKSVKDYKTNRYSTLSPATKAIIDNNWGFMFEEYGYKRG